jgi:pimeloyl-ACP methyl ester carboxylesterase
MRADGFPEDEIQEAVAFMRLKFEVGRTGQGWEKLDATMQELRNKNKKWFPSYTGAPKSLEASRWYWANEFSYDPAPDLKKVKVPVLAIFGELDTLVPIKESARIMEEILKKEGNKDYTIKVLPKVGHGMIVWPEKGSRWHWPRLVDGYLETITEWVLKRVNIPT